MRKRTNEIISTVFGIGKLPLMPGTWASAAGVFIYLAIRNNLFIYLSTTALLTMLGFIVCRKAERVFKSRDPKEVVIDEVCGMLITFLLIPFSTANVVIGFFLFRGFDVLKIYPINKLEKITKGRGIMLDDIVAGIFANIVLQVINFIW